MSNSRGPESGGNVARLRVSEVHCVFMNEPSYSLILSRIPFRLSRYFFSISSICKGSPGCLCFFMIRENINGLCWMREQGTHTHTHTSQLHKRDMTRKILGNAHKLTALMSVRDYRQLFPCYFPPSSFIKYIFENGHQIFKTREWGIEHKP